MVIDRSYVGGLDFCTTATIDQPKSGDGKALAVSTSNRSSEASVPDYSVGHLIDPITCGKVMEAIWSLIDAVGGLGVVHTRQGVLVTTEAPLNDPGEIG